jgi:hypothetical protein
MKEILTMGDITKDFNRLGITIRQTYKTNDSDEYGVCEVTDEEFKILCDEPDDVAGTWEDCGWRYCEGSNQGIPSEKLVVNNKKLICWYEPYEDDEEGLEDEEEPCTPQYTNLLEYLCDHMGCSQPRNVCALTKDLAKYNNMKLSELFKIYQG